MGYLLFGLIDDESVTDTHFLSLSLTHKFVESQTDVSDAFRQDLKLENRDEKRFTQ